MFRAFIKDYLTFNRKDRVGLLTLLLLIVIAVLLPYFFRSSSKAGASSLVVKTLDFEKDSAEISSSNGRREPYDFEDRYKPEIKHSELFDFNPNTISAFDLQRLGLENRTIKTLINYRNKGGRFTKPEDLKRIWGLNSIFYDRVKDHIRIPASNTDFLPAITITKPSKPEGKPLAIVDINLANQSDFIALPGIGEKLSARIINFRDKLGGFYSIDQVGETYALPDSTFQNIKPLLRLTSGVIKKINLNESTKEELKAHPYIRWNLANAIVEYRNQHGNFTKVEDLKAITIIDESTYNKIAPYFSL